MFWPLLVPLGLLSSPEARSCCVLEANELPCPFHIHLQPLHSADKRNALGKKLHVGGWVGREHSSIGHKLSAFCRHRMLPKGCPCPCIWAVT